MLNVKMVYKSYTFQIICKIITSYMYDLCLSWDMMLVLWVSDLKDQHKNCIKNEMSRLCFIRKIRSFSVCRYMMEILYYSVVQAQLLRSGLLEGGTVTGYKFNTFEAGEQITEQTVPIMD